MHTEDTGLQAKKTKKRAAKDELTTSEVLSREMLGGRFMLTCPGFLI